MKKAIASNAKYVVKLLKADPSWEVASLRHKRAMVDSKCLRVFLDRDISVNNKEIEALIKAVQLRVNLRAKGVMLGHRYEATTLDDGSVQLEVFDDKGRYHMSIHGSLFDARSKVVEML